jgi:hypothetical protein
MEYFLTASLSVNKVTDSVNCITINSTDTSKFKYFGATSEIEAMIQSM